MRLCRALLYLAGALAGAFFVERMARLTGSDLTQWMQDRDRSSLAYDWRHDLRGGAADA